MALDDLSDDPSLVNKSASFNPPNDKTNSIAAGWCFVEMSNIYKRLNGGSFHPLTLDTPSYNLSLSKTHNKSPGQLGK